MKDILDLEEIREAAFKCRRLGMYAAYQHLIEVWAIMKYGEDWHVSVNCALTILTMEAQEDGFYG